MHTIPEEIFNLFLAPNQHTGNSEHALLQWLEKNNVKKLSCCSIFWDNPALAPKVAAVIAKSQVQTVDFSGNDLGKHGPQTAANLTAEHSKVHTVNLSNNDLGEDGQQTAANLTSEHSKIISATIISLPLLQLTDNLFNLLVSQTDDPLNSLKVMTARQILRIELNKSDRESLPLREIMSFRHKIPSYVGQCLLFYFNKFSAQDVFNGKLEEAFENFEDFHPVDSAALDVRSARRPVVGR